jgi:NitT/TauT family transport system permease protein
MGICTTIRVAITLLLCTIIAVPIGTYIGNRKKLLFYFKPIIQLFSSFPVNIFYGIFANVAISCRLNFDFICISIMVLGSIWYVLFNVLSGIESIPEDYWKIVQVLKLSVISLWYKFIIPAILPSYVSGIITASGAAWNASILCEYISWKTNTFRSFGIGEYIARNNGNFFEVSLGILIISTIILILNKLIWKPLLQYVAVRFNFIRAEEN